MSWCASQTVIGEISTSPEGPVSFPSCSDEGELDVDAVQGALRDFHQELKDTKKHRVAAASLSTFIKAGVNTEDACQSSVLIEYCPVPPGFRNCKNNFYS